MMTPKIGQFVKVLLPGERPWAECVAVSTNGTWRGRIDNIVQGDKTDTDRALMAVAWFGPGTPPLPKLHDHKYNDVLTFKAVEDAWQPVPRLN
jgi:hypothetical protein